MQTKKPAHNSSDDRWGTTVNQAYGQSRTGNRTRVSDPANTQTQTTDNI